MSLDCVGVEGEFLFKDMIRIRNESTLDWFMGLNKVYDEQQMAEIVTVLWSIWTSRNKLSYEEGFHDPVKKYATHSHHAEGLQVVR